MDILEKMVLMKPCFPLPCIPVPEVSSHIMLPITQKKERERGAVPSPGISYPLRWSHH